jgi:glycosyltransferase involved in cell wall biosynthesis
MTILPVSAIIPTKDREPVLLRTLKSLLAQSNLPCEVIIVDASSSLPSSKPIAALPWPQGVQINYIAAETPGAAHQRMQGIRLATSEFIFFMDDDIIFEEECVSRLFNGFTRSGKIGGVNAMITNQHYTPPGLVTRSMYVMLSGKRLPTWAGMVIGPAWNLLPEDNPTLPEYVPVDWLNTTCTMYRKDALPDPVFAHVFKGYSLLEDLALSIVVGRSWTLLNARTARIFHDSQQGGHKHDMARLVEMDLVNRHYVMRHVLMRKGFVNYFKLFLFAAFGTVSAISSRRYDFVIADLKGKLRALKYILRDGTGRNRI